MSKSEFLEVKNEFQHIVRAYDVLSLLIEVAIINGEPITNVSSLFDIVNEKLVSVIDKAIS